MFNENRINYLKKSKRDLIAEISLFYLYDICTILKYFRGTGGTFANITTETRSVININKTNTIFIPLKAKWLEEGKHN